MLRTLKKYNLRATQNRLEILNILIEADQALSAEEIYSLFPIHCDRATVFRTLKTFTQKGLLHRIQLCGTSKFVLIKRPGDSEDRNSNHLHFHCENCGQVYCMEEIHIEPFCLPNGFTSDNLNFTMEGMCKNCNEKIVARILQEEKLNETITQ